MSVEKVTIPLVGSLNVVVFLAFFLAKIFDKIDWSWWWIFSPLWLPLAVVLSVGIAMAIFFLVVVIIDMFR